MIRRLLTSLLLVLIVGATFAAMERHNRLQADRLYRQDAKRLYSAVAQVGEDLRSDGAGNDAGLYRAQMVAVDRANTLSSRDRDRSAEVDMREALNLFTASAGKWAIRTSDSRPDLLDEATAVRAKGDAILERASHELDAVE